MLEIITANATHPTLMYPYIETAMNTKPKPEI